MWTGIQKTETSKGQCGRWRFRVRALRTCILAAYAAAVILPAAGVFLSGGDVWHYLEFPPLTRYVRHAGFSRPVFFWLAVLTAVTILPFEIKIWFSRRKACVNRLPDLRGFPWWGWLGVAAGLLSWILAWSRFEWFSGYQVFTFSPLWFSYITVVNALTFRRTGKCMLLDRPACLLKLFILSAVFWWYFEYLNRFVQNWYYTGCDGLGRFQYFVFATIPFSTVLPAVLGTYEFLDSFGSAGAGLDSFFRLHIKRPAALAVFCLLFSGAGLALIGIYPDTLFPLLWLSPLVIIVSVQSLFGRKTIFSGVPEGRWRMLYLMAASALVCGFFWEMWNMFSYAKWIYAVPYVGEFRLFEMPVLGYAGYLPFGLECAVIAEAAGWSWRK